MPTLLTWNYDGDHLAAGNKEEPQRVYPGDIGLDDVFGEVVILSMTGGRLLVEYSDGDKKVTNERTVGHIRAKENRVQQRAAPAAGRPRQAKGDLLNFFGAAGREASPLAEPKKKLAPNAKGLGRTVQQPATGKTPAANKQAAKKPTTANKLTGKRKAGADAGGQEELLQEQEANPLAMLLGDAYAASSSEEEEETPAQMRAQPGTLSLRAMSTEHMAAYKHSTLWAWHSTYSRRLTTSYARASCRGLRATPRSSRPQCRGLSPAETASQQAIGSLFSTRIARNSRCQKPS